MILKLGFLGRLGGIGKSAVAELAAIFNPSLLTLSDTHGNVAVARNITGRTMTQWDGTLTAVPSTLHHFQRARLSGGVYYDDDGAGNPLHPSKIIHGEKQYVTKQAYANAQVVAAGGEREDAGKWYSTILGGTTNASTLLTDTGVTDWVEEGIYNRGFCALSEGVATNGCTHSEQLDNSAIFKSGVTISADLYVAPDGLTTMDGVVENGTSTGYFVYWTPPSITVGQIVSASVFIKKTGGRRYWQVGNGAFADGFAAVLDTTTGKITGTGANATSTYISSSVEDHGVAWRVIVNGTNGNAVPYCTVQATDVPSYTVGTISVVAATNTTGIWGGKSEIGLGSSYIPTTTGPATRTEGLGSLKWLLAGSNIITTGPFTLAVGWVPQFASGDIAAANRMIVGANDSTADMISQSFASVTDVGANDGTNSVSSTLAAFNRNDTINLILTANNTASAINGTPANTMQLSVANKSFGESYVVVSAAYDGAFTANTYLQFLKALGGNNSGFRFLKQYDTCLSNADRDLIE